MQAGALASFKLNGEVLLNGQPSTAAARSAIAFVEQEDGHHLSGLTVRETLRFAARLVLPKAMSKKSKESRAEEVLLMLGLKGQQRFHSHALFLHLKADHLLEQIARTPSSEAIC